MTSASALVGFLLSSGGVTLVLLILALWNVLRPRGHRPRVWLVAIALLYAGLGSYPLPHRVALWLGSPFHPLTKADVGPGRTAVVLLGSGSNTALNWSGGNYSVVDPTGADRVLEAVRVFTLIDATWVISSGGEPDPGDPDLPSGVTMREALIQMGVPADRVLLEQQSKTTRDQAVIVAGILRELGADHVVLVTSGVHMRRSLAVFRSAGVDALPAIARTSVHTKASRFSILPSRLGLDESRDVVHELLGLLYYRLRGWRG